jgi:molecular chaperone GrpE
MSWFNQKTEMNEEELEETIKVKDKRRFNEDGDLIDVEVEEEPKVKTKIAEVVRLESELDSAKARYEVAETKLVDVQRRFEEAKGNLEKETSEMRTRLTKTLEQRAKQGQFNFLSTLLPVLDNLNLAIEHAQTDSSLENLLVGVKGTARSFEQALMSVGVKAVPSIGEKFDPEIHEAVDMVEVSADKDELIAAEYSRGYTFDDQLLRPARVQVGKAVAKKAKK